DATTRAGFERKLGVDLGNVRIYTGEFAEQVTRQHSAEAVTVGGTGMILMSGTPDRSPVTAAGQALLAHELTHVAQSARGVYRSAPGERAPLATEEHEAEAEAAEAQVLQEEAGGAPAAGPKVNPEQAAEELAERIAARVMELVYEDERVYALRNGDERVGHEPGRPRARDEPMSEEEGLAIESRHELLQRMAEGDLAGRTL